uniref:Uncharacterized protein n=1 Tax=Globisporangium ultimum (strain ATCC 200006 / CBS 805.95 / DAOM BR144) TaxID=431595 RepID=K3WQC6_GLOUD
MRVFAWKLETQKDAQHVNHSSPLLTAITPMTATPRKLSKKALPEESFDDEPHLRKFVYDDLVTFSWLQCLVSACAYIWLLSNFLRTGMVARNFDGYRALEPDMYTNLGPYAYSINRFFRWSEINVTSDSESALWNYKYDTTSVGMRAFAKFFNVSAFPASVLYQASSGPDDFLDTSTVYFMLNSLIDNIRSLVIPLDFNGNRSPSVTTPLNQFQPRRRALKAQYQYSDRIHHYLAPQIFSTNAWRTCQALHYSSELLALVAAQQEEHTHDGAIVDICSETSYGGLRPYFCEELWTRFSRSCRHGKTKCLAVDRVSMHLVKRLEKLQFSYPNATVDLTVIETSRDFDVFHGGVVFVGKQSSDIVTLFRAQTCTLAGNCTVQVIDEYRYEMEAFTTDMLAWYPIVVALRGAAQTYYWIRLVMLYAGCYCAVAARSRSESPPMPLLTRIRKAFVVFFKVPSQVVIYGSTFPLMSYLLAHIIDAPIVYELTAQKFDSLNGFLHLNFMDLVTISSIQMRNVWVLAGVAHVVVRIATRRAWSPAHGVWSVPQFSIGLVSSLTIISQFRYKSLRRTPVVSIQPYETASRLHPTLGMLQNVNNAGKATLGGVFMDVKAVACSVAALLAAVGILALFLRFVYPTRTIRLIVWRSHSYTPLSAGILWPTSALAVSWSNDLFKFNRSAETASSLIEPLALSLNANKIIPVKAMRRRSVRASHQQSLSFIEIQSLENRPRLAESITYLMNITMLTDPIVFLCWRWYSSKTFLRYYQSKKTKRVYLVPVVDTLHRTELNWSSFTCIRTMAADMLPWSEIITCG